MSDNEFAALLSDWMRGIAREVLQEVAHDYLGRSGVTEGPRRSYGSNSP